MTIGFTIPKFSFGGGERIQLMLMNEFAKLGHNILLFIWDDVEVYHFDFPYELIILKKKRNRICKLVYEIFKIKKELHSRKVDCIIVFGLAESYIFSSFFTKTTSIVSIRVDPRFQKSQIFLKQRFPISFTLCTGIVFQSKNVQQYFSTKFQLKSIIIPNPIIDDFLLTPQLIRKHKIVSVGRLSEEKNYPMLVKAFSNICKDDYTLHIYGEGDSRTILEDLILSTEMKGKIILEGQVDRIVDEISDAEIFVICSDYEGMPNSLIEAMAMGLACISTDFPSGSAADLIQNFENGILIPVNDQKQLEESMYLLMNNKELCSKLRNNAPRVREALNKRTIIDKWINYISLLNGENHFKT